MPCFAGLNVAVVSGAHVVRCGACRGRDKGTDPRQQVDPPRGYCCWRAKAISGGPTVRTTLEAEPTRENPHFRELG